MDSRNNLTKAIKISYKAGDMGDIFAMMIKFLQNSQVADLRVWVIWDLMRKKSLRDSSKESSIECCYINILWTLK